MADAASLPSLSTGSDRRRREKPRLSCHLCRWRKLRCDRKQPCSTCSSRSLQCTYPEGAQSMQSHTQAGSAVLQDRIAQLERLVMSMRPESDQKAAVDFSTAASTDHGPIDAINSPGQIDASKHQYVGRDHWVAIMDNIAALRQECGWRASDPSVSDDDVRLYDSTSQSAFRGHVPLLFGYGIGLTRDDLLAALPPKSVVDRYVSRYFNFQDLVSCTVHAPTFLEEYESFWSDMSNVSIPWISLLFSMMCLAVLSVDGPTRHNEITDHSHEIELYCARTVDGLLLGEYTSPGPFVLETMIHYLYIELVRHTDTHQDLWYVVSLTVNLAMRMGYHRDPQHFRHISVLQGEMRRRVWATVLFCDILVSNSMGLPRIIREGIWDTAEPRNLNDSDMDAYTRELPAPRPETEQTSSLSVIARRRVLQVLGSILDLTADVKHASYADVMRVDSALDEAAAALPPLLKMKPIALSVTEPPQVIMSRIFISFLYQKGKTILHRAFLSTDSPAFERSRHACLNASFEMLQLRKFLDEETKPGGQLEMMRWRVSSILNHHSLTATMIMCSFLRLDRMSHRRTEIVEALSSARATWIQNTARSEEAKDAARTIDAVLREHVQGHPVQTMPNQTMPHSVNAQIHAAQATYANQYHTLYDPGNFPWEDLVWANSHFQETPAAVSTSEPSSRDALASPQCQVPAASSDARNSGDVSMEEWMAQYLVPSYWQPSEH